METLKFRIDGLEEGGTFPLSNTGRGEDRSPAFTIENLSSKARTLAVTLEDISHPIPSFTHWVIWNLPAEDTIPAAIPAGGRVPGLDAVQGRAYGFHRYAGPKPPRRKRHVYRFTVYALDSVLNLGPGAGKRAFFRAAEGHVLQKGSLSGVFEQG